MKSPWCIPIVALFRSCTLDGIRRGFSPIISPFYPLSQSSRRLLSRSHLPHVGIRKTRKSRGGREGRDEQMPAEVSWRERRDGRWGKGREGKKKEDGTQQCPRRCILARLLTRGARRGTPLTNGFVNHGRFKVITHRKKKELMAVVEPRCRQEARRKSRRREDGTGWPPVADRPSDL